MPGGQTYNATNVPVKLMIKLMYHLNDRQISGGPGWLDTELYDVHAKADRPHSLEELHVMFQNLLVDRFRLQFHRDTKELSAYALVILLLFQVVPLIPLCWRVCFNLLSWS